VSDFHDYRPPIAVEHGLKARSARGAIGESWWARRFIDVLESFALGPRLTRGRAYARKGQVLSLDVSPGLVAASVQGSRPKPYAVSIGLKPFPALAWAKVEIALAEQALFSAKLLSGEMPPGIEAVFTDAGIPLFPASIRDLTMRCSCPDHAVPCKHIAATFYLLAEAFDADPFQILAWRGRLRDELLARLRILRGGEPAVPRMSARPPAPGATPPRPIAPGGAAAALADVVAVPLAEAIDRFWVPPVPLPSRAPTLDADPDLLLRQLPPPSPALGGDALAERLRAAYRRMATGGEP
jgi:uncharacterized Zn finger protein